MVKDTLSRVVACVAATTRYPTEILTESADLENDLGIDSVKRLEIVVALSDEFKLDLNAQERDPAVRTIANIATWIEGLLASSESVQPVMEPVTPSSAHENPTSQSRAFQTKSAPTIPAPHVVPNGSSSKINRSSQSVDTEKRLPSSLQSLAGRIAFVTGSGRGVGRTIARLLASRGATVIVNSFHSREQGDETVAAINAQGGTAVHLWGSVANPEHVSQIYSQIEDQFGRLDILVCNASDGRIGNFMDLTTEDWDRAFRTNVTGHHHCAVRAARLMRVSGGGSIVTMSAVGAHGFIDGLGSQGVVKAAVETLTRYLACELGQFGIRVNCVAGGPVYGELLDKFPDSRLTQNHWESITSDGELCNPMELANTVGFLVSDEARGMNGSILMVDHGFSSIADGRPIRSFARDITRTILSK